MTARAIALFQWSVSAGNRAALEAAVREPERPRHQADEKGRRPQNYDTGEQHGAVGEIQYRPPPRHPRSGHVESGIGERGSLHFSISA